VWQTAYRLKTSSVDLHNISLHRC